MVDNHKKIIRNSTIVTAAAALLTGCLLRGWIFQKKTTIFLPLPGSEIVERVV
jgi:hypothetical protein